MARKYPLVYLTTGQADTAFIITNMSNNQTKSLAPTINEQSSNQEPLQLLQETQLCGATLSVYGTPLEPLFLAKEVAEIIGHSDVSTMMRTVDEDEKLTQTLFVSGQRREMWFLTEQGLYEVLMQSRKPIAKDFKRGVKALLKGIRTGEYYLSNIFVRRTNRLLQSAEDRISSLRKAIEAADSELQSRQQERASLTAPLADDEGLMDLEPILYQGVLWYRLQDLLCKAGMSKATPDYIKDYPQDHLRYCGNLFVSKRLGAMIYHRYQINRKFVELAKGNSLGLEDSREEDTERGAMR